MEHPTAACETDLRMVARLASVAGWSLVLRPLRFEASPEWLWLHDFKPHQRPSLHQVLRAIDSGFRPDLLLNLRRCTLHGEGFEMIIQLTCASGRRASMRLVAEAGRDPAGRVVRINGACQDVSTQVEREQELAEHRHRLEELVEERTRDLRSFSYALAHDLRAPINAMAGFSQVVAERLPPQTPQALQRYLGRIVANAQHAEALIEGILELISAAQAPLHKQQVDLTELARNAIAHLRARTPQRQAEVLLEPGLSARGDRRLLVSVIENLVGNAWKYSASRCPARIQVGCQDGVFFVRDNGVGFDMKDAGELFEPLRRLHGAEYEGTGVGLATASRIVSRHGGRIWAEAAPEAGATFWFTLPDG